MLAGNPEEHFLFEAKCQSRRTCNSRAERHMQRFVMRQFGFLLPSE